VRSEASAGDGENSPGSRFVHESIAREIASKSDETPAHLVNLAVTEL